MIRTLGLALDTVAAVATVLLCLLIAANVAARQIFATGIPDTVILVRELMVPAILFPLTTATVTRAHVAIEVFAQLFPDRLNRLIAVFAGLVGLLIAGILLWAGWTELARNWASGAHYGGELNVPKWPSRALFTCAVGFFAVAVVKILLEDLRALFAGGGEPPHPTVEEA